LIGGDDTNAGCAHEQVLDLRPFGVQARVTTSSSATGGEYVEMDCTADLGAGTIIHYHPEQEETFRVLEGTLEVLRDGRWSAVQAGEIYTVPKGAVHAWRNGGQSPLRFLTFTGPPLASKTTWKRWTGSFVVGRSVATRDLRSIIYMSMSAVSIDPMWG
jgi:mannose-6-phosphate isomerase-like protein (cupin superfamily)